MPCVGVRAVTRGRTGLVPGTEAARENRPSPAQEAVGPENPVAQGPVPPTVL